MLIMFLSVFNATSDSSNDTLYAYLCTKALSSFNVIEEIHMNMNNIYSIHYVCG